MTSDDRDRVVEHVAGIPLPYFHDHITTSMPKEIIDAARRAIDRDCTEVGFSGEGRCIEPAVKDGLCLAHANLMTPPVVLTEDEMAFVYGWTPEDRDKRAAFAADLSILLARRAVGPGLTGRVCTDPDCTIPRKPGYPMHGPHDFRARRAKERS